MRVVTFGELMLRLQPYDYLRFVQTDCFEATYGGGEANVAVSLANYGVEASFVSKLPSHEIGQAALNSLRKYGVDTTFIARGGERIGVYYLEKGASQRASKVIYDRAHSSFATSSSEDYDWDKIFKKCDWFHFTGITPALSEETQKLTLAAVKEAKKRKITISCDLNYRNKLWSKEKANKVMSQLMEYVDVLFANEDDAYDVFQIKAQGSDTKAGNISKDGYISVAKQLKDRFNFKYVCITLRTSISASDNKWCALLYDGKAHISKEYNVRIVDRVGGGDSFAGGMIYALLNKYAPQDAIEFAVAASALKHSIEGDYNLVTVDEVKKLAGGDASGRVQR